MSIKCLYHNPSELAKIGKYADTWAFPVMETGIMDDISHFDTRFDQLGFV